MFSLWFSLWENQISNFCLFCLKLSLLVSQFLSSEAAGLLHPYQESSKAAGTSVRRNLGKCSFYSFVFALLLLVFRFVCFALWFLSCALPLAKGCSSREQQFLPFGYYPLG